MKIPPKWAALVVDDDGNDRRYIEALLKRFDFEVASACSILLIIDCEMPRANGLDLIRGIRGNRRCADVYALMVTAHEDLDTKTTALRAGFDDFLMKSTTDVEIVAKIGAARTADGETAPARHDGARPLRPGHQRRAHWPLQPPILLHRGGASAERRNCSQSRVTRPLCSNILRWRNC